MEVCKSPNVTITSHMIEAAKNLNARFEYKPDPRFLDRWKVMRGHPAQGDCDSYALTMAWLLSGESWIRLFRNIFEGRARFIWCETAWKTPHMILEWDGYYIDNIEREWTPDRPHTNHKRRSIPVILLKMIGQVWLGAIALSALIAWWLL